MNLKEFINSLTINQLEELCTNSKENNIDVIKAVYENLENEQIINELINSQYQYKNIMILYTNKIKQICEKNLKTLINSLPKAALPLSEEDQDWLIEQLKKINHKNPYIYQIKKFLIAVNNAQCKLKEELINELVRLLELWGKNFKKYIVAIKPEIQYELKYEDIVSLINEKYELNNSFNIYGVLDLKYWFNQLRKEYNLEIYYPPDIWFNKFHSFKSVYHKRDMIKRWDVPFNVFLRYSKYRKYLADIVKYNPFCPDSIILYVKSTNPKIEVCENSNLPINLRHITLEIFTEESVKYVFENIIKEEQKKWVQEGV